MVTASNDKTWKLWSIDVRYSIGEDAKCLLDIKVGKPLDLIALSPDGNVVAVTSKGVLDFFSAKDGNLINTLTPHNGI